MIVRQHMPNDQSFLIDNDYKPWTIWDEIGPEVVIKIMEIRYPVGFLTYRFCQKVILLQKFTVRDDIRRTGIGTETMHWLINRARKRGLKTIQMMLPEELALDGSCFFLRHCGFRAKQFGDSYVFTRHVQGV